MTNSADPDQKPTDLDLHCLLRQGMSCSAREGLMTNSAEFVNGRIYPCSAGPGLMLSILGKSSCIR